MGLTDPIDVHEVRNILPPMLIYKPISLDLSCTILIKLPPQKMKRMQGWGRWEIVHVLSCGLTNDNEIITYNVLTYKSLKTDQPSHLRCLLSFPSHRSTRSSSCITPNLVAFLSPLVNIANRSFYHSAPVLWNSLPSTQLRTLLITLLIHLH